MRTVVASLVVLFAVACGGESASPPDLLPSSDLAPPVCAAGVQASHVCRRQDTGEVCTRDGAVCVFCSSPSTCTGVVLVDGADRAALCLGSYTVNANCGACSTVARCAPSAQ